jgi:hypothetical protein
MAFFETIFLSVRGWASTENTKEGIMPYTEKQVAALQNAAKQHGTLNGELAAKLAADLGQSKRSVIAKIKSLDLPYTVAAKPVKGTRSTSKAEYVAAIAKALDADASTLAGLEKATALSLSGLLAAIR